MIKALKLNSADLCIPCELRVLADDSDKRVAEKDDGKYPIRLLARSAEAIECVDNKSGERYRILHDNAKIRDFEKREKISLDYNHGEDLIGYADRFCVSEGALIMEGVLTTKASSMADSIAKRLSAGVPYEASIKATYDRRSIIKERTEPFELNGKTYQASMDEPIVVVSNWILCRVAVCPSGQDSYTKVEAMSLHGKEITMSVKTKALSTDMAEDDEEVGVQKARDLVGTYVKEVGQEFALTCINQGLSLEAAKSHCIRTLVKENATLKTELTKLKKQLSTEDEEESIIPYHVINMMANGVRQEEESSVGRWSRLNKTNQIAMKGDKNG